MSVPARRLDPTPRPAPRRTTSGRRPAPAPRPVAPPRGRRRSRAHLGFLVLTGLVATALIVGVVALNALLAQTAFHVQSTQSRVEALHADGIRLTDEAARASSPVVVATWARRHGMVTPAPGQVHILRVPGSDR